MRFLRFERSYLGICTAKVILNLVLVCMISMYTVVIRLVHPGAECPGNTFLQISILGSYSLIVQKNKSKSLVINCRTAS